jgi:hypothetical protein
MPRLNPGCQWLDPELRHSRSDAACHGAKRLYWIPPKRDLGAESLAHQVHGRRAGSCRSEPWTTHSCGTELDIKGSVRRVEVREARSRPLAALWLLVCGRLGR